MKLEALYNAVIVKPVEPEEELHGNIIVPDLGNEKNKTAEVVAVGPGYYSATGVFIETILKAGDIVVLPTMGFSKMEFQGEEYWLGPENQILGKITKN
jgi:co-chaperonin GroES (HSP10)